MPAPPQLSPSLQEPHFCRGPRAVAAGVQGVGALGQSPPFYIPANPLPYSPRGAGLSKPYFSHVCSRGVFVNFYTENVNKGNVETWSPAQGVGAAQTWTFVFQLTPTDSGSQSGRMGPSRCKLALSAQLSTVGSCHWSHESHIGPTAWLVMRSPARPVPCDPLCQAMWWRSKT